RVAGGVAWVPNTPTDASAIMADQAAARCPVPRREPVDPACAGDDLAGDPPGAAGGRDRRPAHDYRGCRLRRGAAGDGYRLSGDRSADGDARRAGDPLPDLLERPGASPAWSPVSWSRWDSPMPSGSPGGASASRSRPR